MLSSVTDGKDRFGFHFETISLNYFFFQILARHLEGVAKNVLWVAFPANWYLSIWLVSFSYISRHVLAWVKVISSNFCVVWVRKQQNPHDSDRLSSTSDQQAYFLLIWVGPNSNLVRLMKSTASEPGLKLHWFQHPKAYICTIISEII